MGEFPRDHADAGRVQPLVTPVLVAHHAYRPAQLQHLSEGRSTELEPAVHPPGATVQV